MNSDDRARHDEALALVHDLREKERLANRAILCQQMQTEAEAKLIAITPPSSDPNGVIDALAVLHVTRGLTEREEELKKHITHLLIAREWLAFIRSARERLEKSIQSRRQKVD